MPIFSCFKKEKESGSKGICENNELYTIFALAGKT